MGYQGRLYEIVFIENVNTFLYFFLYHRVISSAYPFPMTITIIEILRAQEHIELSHCSFPS